MLRNTKECEGKPKNTKKCRGTPRNSKNNTGNIREYYGTLRNGV